MRVRCLRWPRENPHSAASMKPLLILIADDEENIRILLQNWLEAAGHQVKEAVDGQSALQEIKRHPFDLVITDVLMPNGDGVEVISGLKKIRPGTRVLAISGGGRYMASNDCLKIAQGFGANAAVLKPFTREQLLAGIELALAPPAEPSW